MQFLPDQNTTTAVEDQVSDLSAEQVINQPQETPGNLSLDGAVEDQLAISEVDSDHELDEAKPEERKEVAQSILVKE